MTSGIFLIDKHTLVDFREKSLFTRVLSYFNGNCLVYAELDKDNAIPLDNNEVIKLAKQHNLECFINDNKLYYKTTYTCIGRNNVRYQLRKKDLK